jgi:hypothetical protein
MVQERLTGLALISIEHEEAEAIDIDTIIADFAALKPRKVNFSQ